MQSFHFQERVTARKNRIERVARAFKNSKLNSWHDFGKIQVLKKKKKSIRIAGEDLEDPCDCWLTYRICCFIFARSAPDLCHKGAEVKARDESGHWTAALVSSRRWVSGGRYVYLMGHVAFFCSQKYCML